MPLPKVLLQTAAYASSCRLRTATRIGVGSFRATTLPLVEEMVRRVPRAVGNCPVFTPVTPSSSGHARSPRIVPPWTGTFERGTTMNYVEQEIVLHTDQPFGRQVPLSLSSGILRNLQATTKPCVRMAFEGTSTSVGAPPAWLERAVDVRTLGFSEREGNTILHLSAPELGEAAPKLFEQQSLFPGLASSNDTALDLVGKTVREVRREDPTSDFYDRSLLKRIGGWRRIFERELSSLDFPSSERTGISKVPLDLTVVASAQSLSDRTPVPRQVRIVGNLDMVRHSTRAFELILSSGAAVRGILVDGATEDLKQYFGREVTLLGKAIYRPSGTLLRLDASAILPTSVGKSAFSEIPLPFSSSLRAERKLQSTKSGISAFFGSWPGDETDDELLEALAEIRH